VDVSMMTSSILVVSAPVMVKLKTQVQEELTFPCQRAHGGIHCLEVVRVSWLRVVTFFLLRVHDFTNSSFGTQTRQVRSRIRFKLCFSLVCLLFCSMYQNILVYMQGDVTSKHFAGDGLSRPCFCIERQCRACFPGVGGL
jgi:hypothetical protein